MGLKKYEIITVGSDKRVRALRSWQVGDRYVNIGDVGGIVYDEKTLSQDGLCWLFKGNFGFPGARIGGDSIVDVGETGASATPAPNVDILGSSVVVGGKLQFASDQTDQTAAALTFTGTYETKLSIIDSRVAVNPANATGTAVIYPGGTYTIASGAKYPESIIRNSEVVINGHATADRVFRIIGQIIGSTATLDGTEENVTIAGLYSNIKNLIASGNVSPDLSVAVYNIIQATDCDNFAVSSTIFPAIPIAQTANVPFIFQGCNVPDGRFYHHAQIANTYKNIDFAKASVDLGKATANTGIKLVSSEVEGMYRIFGASTFGALVESRESVKSLNIASANLPTSYGTTIYKDAYLNGLFDIAGTNVFGHKVRSHPLAQVLNVAPRAVQGQVNATSTGQTITGVVPNEGRVTVPKPFRINGSQGLSLAGIPAGIDAVIFFTTLQGVITDLTASNGSTYVVSASKLPEYMAYVTFRKSGGSSLTVDEIAGVTVTVYNGCKIVNTGATAVNMKGNIRVEDNATLVNASITGSGYFGGKAVASGLLIEGSVFMSDNASFTKTAGTNGITNLKMTENGVAVLGDAHTPGVLSISENARLQPANLYTWGADLIMSGNAVVTSGMSITGVLRLKDNAKLVSGSVTIRGDITLCGSYNQTVNKTWTGNRVIDSVNAPEYDNNVKTQYDF